MVDYQKHHSGGWDYYFPENDDDKTRRNKVETQIKSCWQVNKKDKERVIFTAPNECELTAFGTIKFECASDLPEGRALVKFFKGPPDKECLVDCFIVDEGSSSSFVLSDFNSITLTLRKGMAPAQGELCISPIFNVD